MGKARFWNNLLHPVQNINFTPTIAKSLCEHKKKKKTHAEKTKGINRTVRTHKGYNFAIVYLACPDCPVYGHWLNIFES